MAAIDRRSSTDSERITPQKEKKDIFIEDAGSADAAVDPNHKGTPGIDPEEERALVRRIDWNVLPMVMLLYLNSFIDRVNIGNARLYNLEADLGMTGNDFQLAVSLLFVTYVMFELPSNLILKSYVRPSRWIAFITLGWGIVACASAAVQNLGGLIACRLLLGAFEAGLFPGCVMYLTFFYTKRELAVRTAFLFSNAALAGAIGGLLAFGIGQMDGLAGWSGWRWIILIEGIPTIIMGVACIWGLADDGHTAKFLTPRQRELILIRRKAQFGSTEEFSWVDVKKALTDWKTYVFSLGAFGSAMMLYTWSTFLPTIVQQIMPAASRHEVQLLTIPIFTCGAIVYFVGAWLSDRMQIRGPFIIGALCIGIVGYIILLVPAPGGVYYFGCCLVGSSIYLSIGVALAWLPSNCPRYGRRTAASGTQIMLANCAGIAAPFLYPTADRPYFRMGHATVLGLITFAVGIYSILYFYYTWENKQKKAGRRDGRIEGLTPEQEQELGDEHPSFIYAT